VNTERYTRVPRPAEEAKSTYDRLSHYYDLLTRFGEQELTRAGLNKLGLGRGEKVLEIGFGTGNAILDLARCTGTTGHVDGIDISEGMCEVARRKVEGNSLADRVTLRRGDARELPYAAREFDAVFLSFTLELFDTPDIPIVLRECRRVLKPAGRIGVVSLSKDRGLGFIGRLYEWLHVRFPSLVDCRPIPVRTVLEEAGFAVTSADFRSLWGLPVAVVLAAP
jgi:ubiquinone/menaquinone biosynthesis C-methylase UbiE